MVPETETIVDPITGEEVQIPKGEANRDSPPPASAASSIDYSGEAELDPTTGEPVRRRGGRPKGSKNKPKEPGEGPRLPYRGIASDAAKASAAGIWGLGGVVISVTGVAPTAGMVMQVQAPKAGDALAGMAAKRWARFYHLLNQTGEGLAIAPFIFAAVVAEMYARSWANVWGQIQSGDLSGIPRLHRLAGMLKEADSEVYEALTRDMPLPEVMNGPPPEPEASSHDGVRRSPGGIPTGDEALRSL